MTNARRWARTRAPRYAIAAAMLLAACAPGATGGRAEAAPAETWLSLGTRTSHGGAFRAAVVRRDGPARPGAAQSWTLRVTDAEGAPLPGARITASAWMPEAGGREAMEARTAEALGGGRYRIDGLRLSAPGWWNVPVRITAGGRTDSLAFNLVLPAGAKPSAAEAKRGGR